MKTENTKAGAKAGPDAIAGLARELEGIHAKMRFVPLLTPEEQARLGTFGPRSSEVLQKRLEAALSHHASLPPTFDLGKFEEKARAVIEVSHCQNALERMLADVRMTLRALGPPVFAESKSVLGYLKVSAQGTGQVHSTVGELKFRPRAGRRSAVNPVPAAKGAEASADGGVSPNTALPPVVTPANPTLPSADAIASKAA